MRYYRPASVTLMSVFAAVGLLFLFAPDGVLSFFNVISARWGMAEMPAQADRFFRILAVGYMYLVSLLAYLMYRFPEDRHFPLLLANGKLASAAVSLYIVLAFPPYLIALTNCVVDGMIGAAALLFYRELKRRSP